MSSMSSVAGLSKYIRTLPSAKMTALIIVLLSFVWRRIRVCRIWDSNYNFRFNRPVLGEFNEGNQSENEAFPFPKSYFNDYCITCQHIGNHFWTFDQSRVFH